MNKLKQFFTNKVFKYGSGSALLIAGFIIAMVVINLIAGTLVDKFSLKIDLTKEKLYEISDTTKTLLKGINSDINIIMFAEGGTPIPTIKEILDRFANENPKIKVQVIDPVKNPMYSQKYTSVSKKIENSSVVFESGKNFKIVAPGDLTADNFMTKNKDLLVAESKFASAIMSVTRAKSAVIGFTEGHGEASETAAETALKNENMSVETFNTTTGKFKDEYDLVIVVSPQVDFTTDEINSLDAFLKKGKNVQIFLDVDTPQLPKLEGYLSDNGISADRDAVIEGDTAKVINMSPYIFVPTLKEHPVNTALISNKLTMAIGASRSFTMLWDEKNGIKVSGLLETSNKAFGRVDPNSTAMGKEPNDKAGPLTLSAVATLSNQDGKQSNIMVTGTSTLIDEQMLQLNKDFFVNSVIWLTDKSEPLNIMPKSLAGPTLVISELAKQLWLIFVVVIMPLIVLLFGFSVWLRRRHL